jgi:hypothetical protein
MQKVFEPRVFHNCLFMQRGTPGVAAKSAATSGVVGFATVSKGPTSLDHFTKGHKEQKNPYNWNRT